MNSILLDEQIRCVRREITMRAKVYPGFVKARRMSAQKAEYELATMSAVLETLVGLKENSGRNENKDAS